jgi:hypothetical protein
MLSRGLVRYAVELDMIKRIVIVVLLLALCIGMALTRPSEQQFRSWFTQVASKQEGNFVQQLVRQAQISAYLDQCTYHNRLLWADVSKDGKTVYTGAFGHWMVRKAAKPTTKPVVAEAQ